MPAATYFIPTPTRTPPSTPTTPTFSMPTTPTPNEELPSKTALAYRLEHAALWARLHGLSGGNDNTQGVHDDAAPNERDRKWAVALCSLAEVAYLVTPDVVRDTLLPFAQSEEEAVGIQFVVDALCAPAVVGAGGWI